MIRELAKSPIKICFIVGIFDGRVSIYIYIYSKKGGLKHGHESKNGGLKNWSCKKDNLSNCCCTKGGFGSSLFINYPYFFLVNMINWWGFTLTD